MVELGQLERGVKRDVYHLRRSQPKEDREETGQEIESLIEDPRLGL